MAIFFAESVNFIFDTWAVSRAKSLDASIEHGRLVEACFEGIVYFLVGVGYVTGQLVGEGWGIGVGEFASGFISWLYFAFGVVEGAAIYSGWGSRFHSTGFEAQLDELFGDSFCGGLTCAASAKLLFADMDYSIQEGAIG